MSALHSSRKAGKSPPWPTAPDAKLSAAARDFTSFMERTGRYGHEGDGKTPAQRARWVAYGNQAVWNVWHPMEAKWGDKTFTWSGWSVDNPSDGAKDRTVVATNFACRIALIHAGRRWRGCRRMCRATPACWPRPLSA